MGRWIASLIVLIIAFSWDCCRAAEPTEETPYTFTLNGLPLVPRVFSLHGDPKHLAPGDLVALGDFLLTLGPEHDCHFIITSDDEEDGLAFDRVFLRLPDGTQRLVGVRVLPGSAFDYNPAIPCHIVDPLQELSAEEIHALWGIYLDAWSEDTIKQLQHVDPARACITLADGATPRRDCKYAIPPLPNEIQHVNAAHFSEDIENFEILQQWKQLRFLRLDQINREKPFDARWLAENRKLCRLDIGGCMIEHPDALSQITELESLALTAIPNLVSPDFVSELKRLRSLSLADTAVRYLPVSKNLKTIDVSFTKVRDLDLLSAGAKHLEEINISNTLVHDLSGLGKLKTLVKITAWNAKVDTLPSRPIPALRSLIAFSNPLSQSTVDDFKKLNPECAIMFKWPDSLRAATTGATRLRIRSEGPGIYSSGELLPFLRPQRILFELDDSEKIADFVRLIEIDEKNSDEGCWDGCCFVLGPTFEFYHGDRFLTSVGWTEMGLCWFKNWPKLEAKLTEQSRNRMVDWLAAQGFDDLKRSIIQQRVDAEQAAQQYAEQHAAIANCYPEEARQYFEQPADDEDIAENMFREEDNEDDQDGQDNSEEMDANGKDTVKEPAATIKDRAAKIADAVSDPVDLAVITCRAMGVVAAESTRNDRDLYLVVEAFSRVGEEEFLKGLERVQGDQQGELGAARLCLAATGGGHLARIPESRRRDWMLYLAPILVNDGQGQSVLDDLFAEENSKDREIGLFLRKIARGQLGRGDDLYYGDVGLRAQTYLMLAHHGAADIQPEVAALLAQTTRKKDVAALEIALALLGNSKYLKPEHLKRDSPASQEALRAIEQFNGREGMDILVETSLADPRSFVRNESLLVFQRITGQPWCDKPDAPGESSDKKPRLFIPDALAWWKEHGAEFMASRRVQK